jgi:hypothetical protein
MGTVTSKRLYQRHLPLFLAAAVVGLFIIQFLTGAIKPQIDFLTKTGTTLSFFTRAFGIVILLLYTVRRLTTEKDYTSKEWYVSFVTLLSFLFIFLWPLVAEGGIDNPLFKNFYLYTIGFIEVPTAHLGCAFGYAAALIRYLRVKDIESGVFALSMFLYIFRELTLFPAIWTGFSTIGTYVEDTIGTPTKRTLVLVAAISALIIGVRTLVGRERGIIEEEVME